MGWREAAVVASIVIVQGPGEGVFSYSPRPGPNNLVASTGIATAGTDRFGNVYPVGDTTYSQVDFGAVSLQGDGVTFYAPRASEAAPLVQNGFIANLSAGGVEVVNLGAVNGFAMGNSPYEFWLFPSGDTTGAIDTANLRTLFGLVSGTVVHLLPGTFYLKANVLQLGLNQYLQGAGSSTTIVRIIDNGFGNPGITIANTSGSYSVHDFAGIGHLTIDGTGTTGSDGLLVANIVQLQYDDIAITNFTGTGRGGLKLLNNLFFTEQSHGDIFIGNCTAAVVFNVSGTGTSSFDRTCLRIWLNMFDGQDGVQCNGGATGVFLLDADLQIRGNFNLGPSGGGHVLNLAGPNVGIASSHLDIGVETDGSGVAPQTIHFGGGSGTNIFRCYGVMDFGGSFLPSNNSNNIDFNGRITGDDSLNAKANTIDVTGVSLIPAGFSGAIRFKKIAESGLVHVKCAVSIAAGTAVAANELLGTVAVTPFVFPTDNVFVVLWLQGGGLNQAQAIVIQPSGQILNAGQPFTPAGSAAFLYGQATYSNSW